MLFVFTAYKDYEVRSVDVVSKAGETFQIWIDPPAGDNVAVHAWDYNRGGHRWEAQVSVAKLDMALEEAMRIVNSWICPVQ